MADLLDRILGTLTEQEIEEGQEIAFGVIEAAMAEVKRGHVTRAQALTQLDVTDPTEIAQLDSLYDKIHGLVPTLTNEEFRHIMTLGSVRNRSSPSGLPYYNRSAVISRLGF